MKGNKPGKKARPPGRSYDRQPDAARLAATRVLYQVYEQGAFANLSARHLLESDELDARDRRFAAALIYETLTRTWTIDYILARISSKPLEKLDPWIRTVLRMGVWQLYWSRQIPPSAAIDEAVRIAGLKAHRGAAGFVNALLRRLSRDPVVLPGNDLPLQTGLPPELFGLLRKWYGEEAAVQIAGSNPGNGTVTARINRLRTTVAALTAQMEAAGINCRPGLYCEEALLLTLQGHSVQTLPGWHEGYLSIQNEAAMLVGRAAGPQRRCRVVDLCAAPGGKTLHLAELSDDQAEILAVDVHSERLSLIRKEADRLGLSGIRCLAADSSTGLDQEGRPAFAQLAGTADLVLADVPCSGLGLLARKPEIRLHMTYERIQRFPPLQAAIMDVAAILLKPGGRLIYSTCTINPEENSGQAAAFLDRHPGMFEPQPLCLPAAVLARPDLAEQAARGQLQLLPHLHGTDGFFIAAFRKTGSVTAKS